MGQKPAITDKFYSAVNRMLVFRTPVSGLLNNTKTGTNTKYLALSNIYLLIYSGSADPITAIVPGTGMSSKEPSLRPNFLFRSFQEQNNGNINGDKRPAGVH